MSVRKFRNDLARLQPVERLPDGRVRVQAHLTRTGIFEYRNPDGSIRRELRPAEEVFRPESMKSFAVVPFTDDHPPDMLDASNATQFAKGSTGDTIVRDDDHIRCVIGVFDADTIRKMDAGKLELSGGYTCDVDETPGVHPVWGAYDAVQRNIVGNHVALVDKGRAGTATVRMDSAFMVQDADWDESAHPRGEGGKFGSGEPGSGHDGGSASFATMTSLYRAAADRAASLKGLKGVARRRAELVQSNAIHAERMRSKDLTEEQALARIAELSAPSTPSTKTDADWDESAHPRASDGKFGSGAEASAQAFAASAKAEAVGSREAHTAAAHAHQEAAAAHQGNPGLEKIHNAQAGTHLTAARSAPAEASLPQPVDRSEAARAATAAAYNAPAAEHHAANLEAAKAHEVAATAHRLAGNEIAAREHQHLAESHTSAATSPLQLRIRPGAMTAPGTYRPAAPMPRPAAPAGPQVSAKAAAATAKAQAASNKAGVAGFHASTAGTPAQIDKAKNLFTKSAEAHEKAAEEHRKSGDPRQAEHHARLAAQDREKAKDPTKPSFRSRGDGDDILGTVLASAHSHGTVDAMHLRSDISEAAPDPDPDDLASRNARAPERDDVDPDENDPEMDSATSLYDADGRLTDEAAGKIAAASFALPGKQRLPIHDPASCKQAMRDFGTQEYDSADEKHGAFNRIVSKATQFGIGTTKFARAHAGTLDRKDHQDMIDAETRLAAEKSKKRAKQRDEARTRADKAETDLAAAQGQIASLTADLAAEKAKNGSRNDAAETEFATKVAAKAELVVAATTILGVGKIDAKMADRDIKVAVIKHVDKTDVPADKHPAYVDALYDGAVSRARADAAAIAAGGNALAIARAASGAPQLPVAGAQPAPRADADEDDETAAAARMRSRSAGLASQPGRMTKDSVLNGTK